MLLRKLNIKKATVYDALSSKRIKIAAPKLVTSLRHMTNRSMYKLLCFSRLYKHGKRVPSI